MAKAKAPGKESAAKTAPKKATKRPAPKAAKAPAKPAAAGATKPARTSGKRVRQGDRLSCDVCGIVLSVDEACGCIDQCDIICCGQQMSVA